MLQTQHSVLQSRCRLVNLEVGVSLVANSCNQVPSYSHLTSAGCEFIFFLCQAAFLAMKSTGGKLLVFQLGVFPSQLELVSSINLMLYLALGIVLAGKMKNC